MTKITTEHLARSAFVYIRQSTAISLYTTRKVGGGSMGSLIVLGSWAGL